jgi:hypothetical protein
MAFEEGLLDIVEIEVGNRKYVQMSDYVIMLFQCGYSNGYGHIFHWM